MAQQDLEKRVENLDMAIAALSTLPTRVDQLEGQFLQLRKEMRNEFSAVRSAIDASGAALEEKLGTQMRVLHEEVIARLKTIKHG